jgi:hypothetical protein
VAPDGTSPQKLSTGPGIVPFGRCLAEAYQQKVACIRVGVVLNLSGMTLAGLAILLSPA